jgi:Nuclear protein Es2
MATSDSVENVGAGALRAVATQDDDKAIFKQPLVPKGRVKKRTLNQVVLDEESYTQELANIIERDFFPDLAEMKERMLGVQNQTSGLLVSTILRLIFNDLYFFFSC